MCACLRRIGRGLGLQPPRFLVLVVRVAHDNRQQQEAVVGWGLGLGLLTDNEERERARECESEREEERDPPSPLPLRQSWHGGGWGEDGVREV